MWKHVNKVRFTLARLTFCCVIIIQFYEALLHADIQCLITTSLMELEFDSWVQSELAKSCASASLSSEEPQNGDQGMPLLVSDQWLPMIGAGVFGNSILIASFRLQKPSKTWRPRLLITATHRMNRPTICRPSCFWNDTVDKPVRPQHLMLEFQISFLSCR